MKYIKYFLILLIVIVLLYRLTTSENLKDRQVWNQLKTQLQTEEIVSIKIDSLQLDDNDQKMFLDRLLSADFGESNRQGYGPTPTGIIQINTNQHQYRFSYFGGENGISPRLETMPLMINAESQFYIESIYIALFLDEMLLNK